MANNMNKLDSKRMSGKAVREDKHEELLKVLNEMTTNKSYKQLASNSTVDTVIRALEFYDEVRIAKNDLYIRISKPNNGKYVWFVNGRQYGFNADSNGKGFTYDSRYLKEGINSPISVNYTGEQRFLQVLEDLLK